MIKCPVCSYHNLEGSLICDDCGISLRSPLLNNHYKILETIGLGGFGKIYKAEDITNPRRIVAIKCIPITDPLTEKDFIKQFEREAKILKILSHENLPSIYEYFKGIDIYFKMTSFYIVMDFIDGKNLLDIIEEYRKEKKLVPENQVISWMIQICKAVEYIHTKAIIHRDIKPPNLILSKKGRVFLVDFGISKVYNPLNPVTTKSIKGKGTEGYAPPEQYGTGEHTDIRSDIYALGATLYHLLTGEPPPPANSRLFDPNLLKPPTRINKNISPSLEQCILKAMAVMVKDRYNSVGEFLDVLTGKILEQPVQCPKCLTYNSPSSPKCLHCDTSFIMGRTVFFNFKTSPKKPKDLEELIEAATKDKIVFQNLIDYHFFTGDLSSWLSSIGYGNYAAEARDLAIKWKPYPEQALWIFLWKAGYSKIRFHDGEEAENIDQFINLSLKYPDVGEKMLYKDFLIEWLKIKGEVRGVKEVEDIVKSKWSHEPEKALLIFLWRMGLNKISFSSSEEAENIDQFIELSDKYKDKAKEMLYSGLLSEWLKSIGEAQGALKADEIVKTENNKDIGLEKFLESIGATKPIMNLSEKEINLGKIFQDTKKKINIQISNKGRGYIYGKAKVDKQWCTLNVEDFEGNLNILNITVNTDNLGAGSTYKATVSIKSNGGDFNLPISIKILFPCQKILVPAVKGAVIGSLIIFILGNFLFIPGIFSLNPVLRPSVYKIFGHTDLLLFIWGIFGAFLGIIVGLNIGFNQLNQKTWKLLLAIALLTAGVFLWSISSKPVLLITTNEKIPVKIYDCFNGITIVLDASHYQNKLTNLIIDKIKRECQNNLLKHRYILLTEEVNCVIVPFYKDLYSKGNYYLEKENYKYAITCFDKALKIKPDYIYLWNSKRLTLEKDGNYKQALNSFEKILELDHNNVLKFNDLNKGDIYYKYGDYEKAIKYYNKVLHNNPSNVELLFKKGKALACQNKYDEAIKYYNKVLHIEPTNKTAKINKVETFTNKGNFLYKLNKYDEAIKCYDKALEIEPDNESLKLNKFNALEKMGEMYFCKNNEECLRYYTRALDINPEDSSIWHSKGQVLAQLKKYEEAIECYDKALNLKSYDSAKSFYWHSKGQAYYNLKNYMTAIECYDKALELDPNNKIIWYDKGECYFCLGDIEEDVKCKLKASSDEVTEEKSIFDLESPSDKVAKKISIYNIHKYEMDENGNYKYTLDANGNPVGVIKPEYQGKEFYEKDKREFQKSLESKFGK